MKEVPWVLTRKQEEAAYLLFNDEKIQDIARSIGVNRSTIWRWKKRRDMREQLQRYEDEEWERILEEHEKWKESLMADLHSEDPYIANATANRMLDLYGWILFDDDPPLPKKMQHKRLFKPTPPGGKR